MGFWVRVRLMVDPVSQGAVCVEGLHVPDAVSGINLACIGPVNNLDNPSMVDRSHPIHLTPYAFRKAHCTFLIGRRHWLADDLQNSHIALTLHLVRVLHTSAAQRVHVYREFREGGCHGSMVERVRQHQVSTVTVRTKRFAREIHHLRKSGA